MNIKEIKVQFLKKKENFSQRFQILKTEKNKLRTKQICFYKINNNKR